jgi:hypothetical protein
LGEHVADPLLHLPAVPVQLPARHHRQTSPVVAYTRM